MNKNSNVSTRDNHSQIFPQITGLTSYTLVSLKFFITTLLRHTDVTDNTLARSGCYNFQNVGLLTQQGYQFENGASF